MSGFRLLLAVSADDFLARGPGDNMDWTSKSDKFLFRLLTSGGTVVVGRRTYDVLPPLKNRDVYVLTRGCGGLSLIEAYKRYDGAWLIGGPDVAEQALRQKLVDRAYICRQHDAVLGDGIPYGPLAKLLPSTPTFAGTLEGGLMSMSVYLGLNHGP